MTRIKIGARVIGSDIFYGGHITGNIIAIWEGTVRIITDDGTLWEVRKSTLTFL